jgi:hypothetical protein
MVRPLSKIWTLLLGLRSAKCGTVDELLWADEATLANLKLPFHVVNAVRREHQRTQSLRVENACGDPGKTVRS